MASKATFGGLDWLKFMAALLVIANHTAPLIYFDKYADFLLSSIITRVDVPIFFLSSGFFFFRKLTGDKAGDRIVLFNYSKKIALLYLIAILLYIPLNVYTGYFTEEFTVYSFLKDIVFDGTFYHLWYLPASLTGIYLTYYLHKKVPISVMLIITGLLYIAGLLGDSYYGITENIEGLSRLYEGMFLCFDYTRNGLFFAPIYFALGASLALLPPKNRRPIAYASLFILSMALLLAEGMLLKAAEFPRHDSMYIFSLPAVYFLFRWALLWKGGTGKAFRQWRVWLYILHPIAIVLVRGAAEAIHLESLFITNTLVHFAAVCVVSILLSIIVVRLSVIKFTVQPYRW